MRPAIVLLALLLQTPTPQFEAASIKPTKLEGVDVQGLGDVIITPGRHFSARKALLRYFIQSAYALKPFQVLGGPGWINASHYDVEATADHIVERPEMRVMMQSLLADRFKLKAHHETRDLPVYELSVAKSGSKMRKVTQITCAPSNPNLPASATVADCERMAILISPPSIKMTGDGVSIAELVRVLSNILGRTVIDKSKLSGLYDVQLRFALDETLAGLPRQLIDDTHGAAADAGGSLFAAIQEQLGLKLVSTKGPVDVLVIDSIERPTEN